MKELISKHRTWIDHVWKKIEHKIGKTSRRIGTTIACTTSGGKYVEFTGGDGIAWWTNGFWPGILWLMYQETKDEFYKTTAEAIEDRLDEALYDYDKLHHDVGFMWLLSSVANYKNTGNDKSRKRALTAASILASRYYIGGGFIRAWNWTHVGLAIIDCMMNIPLLYWASEMIEDKRLYNIAVSHANKTLEAFIRPDGSVNHMVVMNPDTGEITEVRGGQGYAAGSSWSRGQAWALYGFAQSYGYTNDVVYLDAAKSVAHYFLSDLAMKGNFVPDCDFRQPKEPAVKDTSAGAVAACGLIEIAKSVSEHERELYLNGAIKILQAMDKEWGIWDDSCEALLGGGTPAYHEAQTRHTNLIYADYYFIEAVTKLKALLYK